jgi:hypothetical protein
LVIHICDLIIPKLIVSQGKVQEGTQFNSECLLPNAGWVRRAREPSDELISTAGLDAFVFIRIFVLR